MNNQLLLLLVIAFAGLLFWVARRASRWQQYPKHLKPYIYALSLAVYCSSWTFFGAVGSAVNNGWDFAAIYLGPILVFLLGWPFVRRLTAVGARHKVTSIADFIGSRYGKSQLLASLVTVFAVVAALPYIALQLKAVTTAWELVFPIGPNQAWQGYSSLITTLVMILFAVMFGTSAVVASNRNTGLVTAISVEAIIKLVAFVVAGGFALALLSEVDVNNFTSTDYQLLHWDLPGTSFVTATFLSATAIICLPRQFHLMVVEKHTRADLRMARKLLPAYLFLITALAIPIAITGQFYLGSSDAQPDSYILQLPLFFERSFITGVILIGGIAAATGMVLVASVALAIMVSNEIVVPLWLKSGIQNQPSSTRFSAQIRQLRGSAIVVILLLGWLLERELRGQQGLASVGLVAFAASAQFLPAIVGALFWPQAHRKGVIAGLAAGMAMWTYCLLLPALLPDTHPLLRSGPWDIHWLSPINLFASGSLDPLTHGVFWSLFFNIALFVTLSLKSEKNTLDLRQQNSFIHFRRRYQITEQDLAPTNIEIRQLQTLVEPLLGSVGTAHLWTLSEQRLQHRLLPSDKAPRFVVDEVEKSLTAVIGAISAHRAISLLHKQRPLQLEDFVSLVGGTSRQLHFSQELLQTTFESIPQGISVVDERQRLVAWNQPYVTLFDYPPRLLYVGCPVERVYQFNVERGYVGANHDENPDKIIQKRIELLKEGKPYHLERALPNGKVVDIQGLPLNNGGYVTTYTDITEFRSLVSELESAKATLEHRVEERTTDLQRANLQLQEENRLRATVEQQLSDAHISKTRFMQSASHDLLQPINAARLFLSTLTGKEKPPQEQLEQTIAFIDESLASAETLIASLREIARLENGRMQPEIKPVSCASLMQQLFNEFQLQAREKGLRLESVVVNKNLHTDHQLLHRILQNLLSNAIKYTQRGKVLFGARRRGDILRLQVWDTGPGLNRQEQEKVFQEFQRLGSKASQDSGLGLGLSIAQRMAQLLGTQITLDSRPGSGSCFNIDIPISQSRQGLAETTGNNTHHQIDWQQLPVLCIDNEAAILESFRAVLEQHHCQVHTASDAGGLEALIINNPSFIPAIVFLDYHLDDGMTGLELLKQFPISWKAVPVVLVSADITDPILAQAKAQGLNYLPKPVSADSLISMLKQAVG